MWWVSAEQPELIGPQLAALAVELGCSPPGAETSASVRKVLADLRIRDQWLLIFDNASSPAGLRDWLPDGDSGHVLITSRSGGWDEIAATLEINVFERTESVALLQTRVNQLSAHDAGELAAVLGDLPLAVAQTAQYLAETGMSPGEYMELLATRAAELLSEGRPDSYPLSLAAAIRLAAERLENEDPAAIALLNACAFLAPEPIPTRLISAAAENISQPLGARAADPVTLRACSRLSVGQHSPGWVAIRCRCTALRRQSCVTVYRLGDLPTPTRIARRSSLLAILETELIQLLGLLGRRFFPTSSPPTLAPRPVLRFWTSRLRLPGNCGGVVIPEAAMSWPASCTNNGGDVSVTMIPTH